MLMLNCAAAGTVAVSNRRNVTKPIRMTRSVYYSLLGRFAVFRGAVRTLANQDRAQPQDPGMCDCARTNARVIGYFRLLSAQVPCSCESEGDLLPWVVERS